MRTAGRVLPLLVVAGTIVVLSHQPDLGLPDLLEFPQSDKLGHLALYTCLGLAAVFALPPHRRPGRLVLAAALFCLAFGITDEFHQAFVPGRTPEVADLAADTVGGLLAGLLHRIRPLP